jgi:competence protein ComEC
MGSLALLAKHWGRLSKIGNIIVLTIVTMLLLNPKILLYDLGFQLSILSTLGLIYFSPVIEKYFRKLPEKFGLRDNITATLSATALTAPLIIYNFGRQSIISLPVNLLVLPAIPIAMLLGFIMLIIGTISFPMAQVFGYISYAPLKYIMSIINQAAMLPLTSINLKISLPAMLVAYIFLIIKIKNLSKVFERLKSNEQTGNNKGHEPKGQN